MIETIYLKGGRKKMYLWHLSLLVSMNGKCMTKQL